MQRARLRAAALALLSLSLLPQAAWAQIYRGDAGSPSDRKLLARPYPNGEPPAGYAREQMQKFARCILVRAPVRTEKYLSMPAGSKAANDEARSLSSRFPDCLVDGGIQFYPVLLRGALYEVLYARDHSDTGPTRFATAGDAKRPRVQPAAEMSDEAAALMTFGECVVLTDGMGSQRLVLAKPGSAEETVAVRELAPTLASCLPPKQTVRFSLSVLRGGVAEMLYRMSMSEPS